MSELFEDIADTLDLHVVIFSNGTAVCIKCPTVYGMDTSPMGYADNALKYIRMAQRAGDMKLVRINKHYILSGLVYTILMGSTNNVFIPIFVPHENYYAPDIILRECRRNLLLDASNKKVIFTGDYIEL
jgi:hypothetical protein